MSVVQQGLSGRDQRPTSERPADWHEVELPPAPRTHDEEGVPLGRRERLVEQGAYQEALSAAVLAHAARSGYVLVGPSAETWRRDSATGEPVAPATPDEHQALRELLGREAVDTTEPEYVTGADGSQDVRSVVVLGVGADGYDQEDDEVGDHVVAVVDDCDAAVACAAAATTAAEAARQARADGDDDAVGVVVVEELSAACDEDGGF